MGLGDLGKAGTGNPNGAFAPDDDDEAGQRVLREDAPRRREIGSSDRAPAKPPSVFMEQPDEDDANSQEGTEQSDERQREPRQRKPAAPRAEPPSFDWMAESARARARSDQDRMFRTQQLAMPMIQRLQQLPDPRAFTIDQISSFTTEERERFDQARIERSQIESNLGQIPIMVQSEAKVDYANVATAIQLQRRYAEEYPEIAQEVLDKAKVLGGDQQADPQVYEFLVNEALGRQAREKMGKEKIRQAGARVSSQGRGGHSEQISVGVSSVDRNKLRRMGIKGAALDETVERALRGQNG